MIKFRETNGGLDIIYNNEILISHQIEKPAFYMGRGIEEIESYRGNFRIEDYITERIGLESYHVENDTVTFSHNEMFLELRFCIQDNRLHITTKHSNHRNRFWMRLFAEKEEYIYGCGEQASYFNLRGRNFPLWTSEPGVGRDKKTLTTFYADLHDKAGGDYYNTYYPEQTFVSSRKYWFHSKGYGYAEFNFKFSAFHELFYWNVPEEFIFSYEDSYLDIVHDITEYTSHIAMLPEYLLDGIVLGVQGGMSLVKEYLQLAQEHNVVVSGLWCQDWAGYKHTTFGKRLFWNWVLNEDVYPNLVEEIKLLQQKNVNFLTYICPFLLEKQSLFQEAKDNNYLVLNQDNENYLIDFGEFYCGAVDLTNPAAFEWYKGIIKTNLIDLGIKGWMADFGEYLPIDAVLHNGVDAKVMHNEWPVLWAKCNYEALKETDNLGKIFYFMRSGNHGSQKYASSLWAGDQSVNFELHDGIPSVIPSALSVGMIGNPFTHSDIGGYTSLHGNVRTKELFVRWLEMSVFTTLMRTHEGNRPTDNFQFYDDTETLQYMSKFTNLRVDLKPYIQSLYEEATTLGYPVQRPLFMHYEKDINTYNMQYAYLFGKDMLVEPVLNEGQTIKEVYLPEDKWVHLWTGKEYSGNKKVTVEAEMGYIPVFYRKDSSYSTLFNKITEKYKKGGS